MKRAGYPLALVSNWPCGLSHFCTELGLSVYFDHVLASGEIGAAKPDGRIFAGVIHGLDELPAYVSFVQRSAPVDR